MKKKIIDEIDQLLLLLNYDFENLQTIAWLNNFNLFLFTGQQRNIELIIIPSGTIFDYRRVTLRKDK